MTAAAPAHKGSGWLIFAGTRRAVCTVYGVGTSTLTIRPSARR